MSNMENLEEIYSQKQLILAQYLRLTEDQISEIDEGFGVTYYYVDQEYLVYSLEEIYQIISDLTADQIQSAEYQASKLDLGDYCDMGCYMTICIDEDAIRGWMEDDFGYYIGNGENDYDEFNGYYIFKN